MATPWMLINPFSLAAASGRTAAFALLGLGVLIVAAALVSSTRRARRRRAVQALARARGLSERSIALLGELFQGEQPGVAESMLGAGDLLIKRLVLALGRQRGREAALRFAADAARVLEELNLRTPAFPGAPCACDPLRVTDPAEPQGASVIVFVGAADQRNLIVVSPEACPWPLRRALLAAPLPLKGFRPAREPDEASAALRRPPFGVALLLQPMPPQHEWVLTHSLVEVITNRRAAVRVPCRIDTVALSDSGDPVFARQRLQREERVTVEELRATRAWSQRLNVTVLDISAEGARLSLDQPIELHQRLHLLLAPGDDVLLALPLAEVVDLQRGDEGRLLAGMRFIGVRLKERLRLAEFVRTLETAPAARSRAPHA